MCSVLSLAPYGVLLKLLQPLPCLIPLFIGLKAVDKMDNRLGDHEHRLSQLEATSTVAS